MRRILKRILVMALVAAVLVPVVPAQALYYNGSSSYESGKYYQNLTEVVLTGDPRVDIVNIAMSQLGYQEGGSQNQLSGEVYGGVNHTEFGRWYGMQDMWCAMFVSWCANTAGISENVIPHHSYTPNGLNWFIKRGQAWAREQLLAGEYTPQPGDVIYFRSSRNKKHQTPFPYNDKSFPHRLERHLALRAICSFSLHSRNQWEPDHPHRSGSRRHPERRYSRPCYTTDTPADPGW